MKLANILIERADYIPYRTMVQVVAGDESPSRIADLLRALPGVTTVTAVGNTPAGNAHVYRVKLITQKSGKEAFDAFKDNAISKYPDVKMVKVAYENIEQMKTPSDY